jgi:hypothetical protein
MDIELVDVTLHIDESLDERQREKLEEALRAVQGVVSVHLPEDRRHLVVVEYDPAQAKSQDILKRAVGEGIHAELVGL